MNQQERFEKYYADQHDIDVEDVAGYRIQDTYSLPGIASHYRTFKAAEDGAKGQGAPVEQDERAEFDSYMRSNPMATYWSTWQARAALEHKP